MVASKQKFDIKNLPNFDRPREKLALRGPNALSDQELLAILLGSGVRGKNVFEVAEDILKNLDKNNDITNIASLKQINGIGNAKASQIIAALEFSRRRFSKRNISIKTSNDVIPYLNHIRDKKQEHFVCISLNGAHEVIKKRIVTVGLLNSTQVHPREVFANPISDRAASVILAHNHPSGQLVLSQDDIAITKQLVEAGKILGIKVLDHIIITKSAYLSMKEEGYL